MNFQPQEHFFPIRHLVRDHLGKEIFREEYFFAQGSQKRVSVESKQIVKTVKVPETAWEHFKEALTNWEPTLKFGWLIPKYRETKVCFDYVENQTYYNVMPIDRPPYGEDVIRMAEFTYGVNLRDSIKPIDWLTGEPPTQQQIQSVPQEIMELRTSERFRFYMN